MQRVAVWGLGREGRAAVRLLRARHPNLRLLLLDDTETAPPPSEFDNVDRAFGADAIGAALGQVDVLVKSPGSASIAARSKLPATAASRSPRC